MYVPNLYVIAGCNGAGKTTSSFTVLPEMLDCREFVNADEIARGLSPFQPETVSFQSGRIMLRRIKELIREHKDFGFETTLASKTYKALVNVAISEGYKVTLIYLWLESVELAKNRVLERVRRGGHNIPPLIIERRYWRGLKNFFRHFMELAHTWVVYDNSKTSPHPIATGSGRVVNFIHNADIWETISSNQ